MSPLPPSDSIRMGWLSRTAALAITPASLILISMAVSHLAKLRLSIAFALVALLSVAGSAVLAVTGVRLLRYQREHQFDLMSIALLTGLVAAYFGAGRWFVLRVARLEGQIFADLPLAHDVALLALAALFFLGFSVILAWFSEAVLWVAGVALRSQTIRSFRRWQACLRGETAQRNA